MREPKTQWLEPLRPTPVFLSQNQRSVKKNMMDKAKILIYFWFDIFGCFLPEKSNIKKGADQKIGPGVLSNESAFENAGVLFGFG